MSRQNLIRIVMILSATMLFAGCWVKEETIQEIWENQISTQNQISLEWNYQSVMWVMDNLSCYCFNAGYLTTQDWQSIPICLENSDKAISCTNISISGIYKTKTINPDSSNPCPTGEMKYFSVENYECK